MLSASVHLALLVIPWKKVRVNLRIYGMRAYKIVVKLVKYVGISAVRA